MNQLLDDPSCTSTEVTEVSADHGVSSALLEAMLLMEQAAESDTVRKIGRHWLERAHAHLVEQLEREFIGTAPKPTSERQAMAIIKTLALELKGSGEALKKAAYYLKEAGKGNQAQEIFKAGVHSATVAKDWHG